MCLMQCGQGSTCAQWVFPSTYLSPYPSSHAEHVRMSAASVQFSASIFLHSFSRYMKPFAHRAHYLVALYMLQFATSMFFGRKRHYPCSG